MYDQATIVFDAILDDIDFYENNLDWQEDIT